MAVQPKRIGKHGVLRGARQQPLLGHHELRRSLLTPYA